MLAELAAILFTVIAILTLLVALGLPFGEFTMGGQHKILPPKVRIVAGCSFLIQLLAIIVVLQAGGHIPLWFPSVVTKGTCKFFAAYLSLNMIMNALSKSKKERYVMTPLSLVAAICFWITAFAM